MFDWTRAPRRDRPAMKRGRRTLVPGVSGLEPRLLMAVDVLTYHNDNARTGANPSEVALTPQTVKAATFGRLAGAVVDGQAYAQPLVKTGVTVPGVGVRNVVYVATEHDSVYAFDADTLAPLWHDSFINPAAGVTTVPSGDVKTSDLYPEVGITSTPVIDPATSSLYVVSQVKVTAPGAPPQYMHQLHALDLGTGAETHGGPVVIQASVPGRGSGAVKGRVAFQSQWENQRAALTLVDGVVYAAFASFGDNGPYHGWVLGYDAASLKQVAAFNATPNGSKGGIWMSGAGLSADSSGALYLTSGNGTFRSARVQGDYGDTVVKLAPGPAGLTVTDYFTPSNQAYLQRRDLDLGSGGILLLPDQAGDHPHVMITGGKEGRILVIDRDHLGKSAKKDKTVEQLSGAMPSIFSTPAYFNGTVYYVGTTQRTQTSPGGGDLLRAYSVVNGRLAATPKLGGYLYGYPGASPSVSSSGASGGIVWTLDSGGPVRTSVPGVLRAYDASDVSRELYDSTQAGGRDGAPVYVKFSVPTVANGKVYAAGSGALLMYGLLKQKGA